MPKLIDSEELLKWIEIRFEFIDDIKIIRASMLKSHILSMQSASQKMSVEEESKIEKFIIKYTGYHPNSTFKELGES